MPRTPSRPWFLVAALSLLLGVAVEAAGAPALTPAHARVVTSPRQLDRRHHLPRHRVHRPAGRRHPARPGGPVITAAGDIARENGPGGPQTATAALIRRINPTAVLTLGDNQYPNGSLGEFRSSYAPTWGRFRAKTFPVPGNHEYETAGARGYFAYFGRRAHGRPGWYAYTLGSWRMIALDSITGDDPPSAELRWLRRELGHHHRRCQLAYFHHPRFSSGSSHGSNPNMGAFWNILQRYHVDVVLNGHDHDYERFARLLPSGHPSVHGIREFVVGTGGAGIRSFGKRIVRGSQVRRSKAGVLRMQLHHRSYGWKFIRTGGKIADRGATNCH